MLFLNTLYVSASVSNLNDILDTSIATTNGYITTYSTQEFYGSIGSERRDTEQSGYTTTSYYSGHYNTNFPFKVGSGSINVDEYYYFDLSINSISQNWTVPYNIRNGAQGQIAYNQNHLGVGSTDGNHWYWTVNNIKVLDGNDKVVSDEFNSSSGDYHYSGYIRGYDLLNGVHNSTFLTLPLYLDFDLNILNYTYSTNNGATVPQVNSSGQKDFAHFNLVPSYSCTIYSLKSAYKYDIGGTTVTDTGTQRELNTLNETQESIKETTEDTNETTHSIFDSISDFFGSFFSNLIGVFVPESGFFETWFSNLNQLLEDKLGILYWPFSKIIAFFTRLQNALTTENSCIITFPAIEFTNQATGETYTFLEAQQVNLETYNYRVPLSGGSDNSTLVGSNRFNSLVSIVRTFNSAALIFGFLALLRAKLHLIMRGDDNDN